VIEHQDYLNPQRTFTSIWDVTFCFYSPWWRRTEH